MKQAYCTTNLQYKHAPNYSCIHTRANAHSSGSNFQYKRRTSRLPFFGGACTPLLLLGQIDSPCSCLWIRPSTVPRLMFIQTRGPLAACLINNYVLKKCLLRMWGPWSSGAWGPGPNGPVVDPPLSAIISF